MDFESDTYRDSGSGTAVLDAPDNGNVGSEFESYDASVGSSTSTSASTATSQQSNNYLSLSSPDANAKGMHPDKKATNTWELNRLYDQDLHSDKGRVQNGWRYSFDLNKERGRLTLSNGSYKLIFERVSREHLSEIKTLILKMHKAVNAEKYGMELYNLATKSSGKPDVVVDDCPDACISIASAVHSKVKVLNERSSVTEAGKAGSDRLRLVINDKDVDKANPRLDRSIGSNYDLKQMNKNPKLFFREKMPLDDNMVKKFTYVKEHGDEKKSFLNTSRGNWNEIDVEMNKDGVFVELKAQSHVGRRNSPIERRLYIAQRNIEDKVVIRIENFAKGLIEMFDLCPRFIREGMLRAIRKISPDYNPDNVKEGLKIAAPYILCAAATVMAVAAFPIVAPYLFSAFSTVSSFVAPVLSWGASTVGSIATSVGGPYVSSFVATYPTTASWIASSASYLGTTFPGAFTSFYAPYVASVSSFVSPYLGSASAFLSPYLGGSLAWASASIPGVSFLTANASMLAMVGGPLFLTTTRLGAKTIGVFGKFCAYVTPFNRVKPTSARFKIANLSMSEGMGGLEGADGQAVADKIAKILEMLSDDRVSSSANIRQQTKQAFTSSYVETNWDTISRSNLLDDLLADQTIVLDELKNAELNGCRWLGMGQHLNAKLTNCRAIESNMYLFSTLAKDCEFFRSKVWIGSGGGQGTFGVDGGYWDDTTALLGKGSHVRFVAPSIYKIFNPFESTMRFKADLTQVESMKVVDYNISPNIWYHPFQSLQWSLVYGGMHVSDVVKQANSYYEDMFDDGQDTGPLDRRLTRHKMYVQVDEFFENLTHPSFFKNMNAISDYKIMDHKGTVYEADFNGGYMIKKYNDLKKSNNDDSTYNTALTTLIGLDEQGIEELGRYRSEKSLTMAA